MSRIAAFAVLAVLAAGCGSGGGGGTTSSSPKSAAAFVEHVTTEFSRGQTGPLWDELHPAEQALVSRARFIGCEQNEGFGLRKIKVLETYQEKFDIGGKPTPSTAVTLQVTSDDGITTATLHAIRVGDTWRWMLQPSDLAAYKRGTCPAR